MPEQSEGILYIILVKCLLSYEVLKSFVRKVRKPAVNQVVALRKVFINHKFDRMDNET